MPEKGAYDRLPNRIREGDPVMDPISKQAIRIFLLSLRLRDRYVARHHIMFLNITENDCCILYHKRLIIFIYIIYMIYMTVSGL